MALLAPEKPPQVETKKKGKKKEKRNPLDSKFQQLSQRAEKAIGSVKRMSLNVERMISHTKTMDGVAAERKQSFLDRAKVIEGKNTDIKTRVERELNLLTRLQENGAFASHNSPIIEKRLKAIEKELEQLQKEWNIKSASRELTVLGPREPTQEHVELYEQIKGPVGEFISFFDSSVLENEVNALKKDATNLKKPSETANLLMKAEEIAIRAKELFVSEDDRKKIDEKLKTFAFAINEEVVFRHSQYDQIKEKYQHHAIKPFTDYLLGNASFKDDVEKALIEIAYNIPDDLSDEQLAEQENLLLSINDMTANFDRYRRKKDRGEVQLAEQEKIYDDVVMALLQYESPEAIIKPSPEGIEYLSAEKMDEYVENPPLFIRDTETALHALNLEFNGSGDVPTHLFPHYNEVMNLAQQMNASDLSTNEKYRLVNDVDEELYDYSLRVIQEVIDDESNDYTAETYFKNTILDQIQSILHLSDESLLPDDLQIMINETIDEAHEYLRSDHPLREELLSANLVELEATDRIRDFVEQRHLYMKSFFEKVSEIREKMLAFTPSEQFALRIEEITGSKPTKENPPQLDIKMSDPDHLRQDVELIVEWLKSEFGVDPLPIEDDLNRYVMNFTSLNSGGNIIKMLDGKAITEQVPENKQANLMPLQVRNINKAIKRFVETQEKQEQQNEFTSFLQAIGVTDVQMSDIQNEYNQITTQDEAISFLTDIYQKYTKKDINEVNSEVIAAQYAIANPSDPLPKFKYDKDRTNFIVSKMPEALTLPVTDNVISRLPVHMRTGVKELQELIRSFDNAPVESPLKAGPGQAIVEYADLGEFDEETGLFTGEIGAGLGPQVIEFQKEFPEKDWFEALKSLDFTSEGTKEASASIARSVWNKESKLVAQGVLDTLPSVATNKEEKKAKQNIGKWLRRSAENLDDFLSTPHSAEEVYDFLLTQIEEIENTAFHPNQEYYYQERDKMVEERNSTERQISDLENGEIKMSVDGIRNANRDEINKRAREILESKVTEINDLLDEMQSYYDKDLIPEDVNNIMDRFNELDAAKTKEIQEMIASYEKDEALKSDSVEKALKEAVQGLKKNRLDQDDTQEFFDALQSTLDTVNDTEYIGQEDAESIINDIALILKEGVRSQENPELADAFLQEEIDFPGMKELITLVKVLGMKEDFLAKYTDGSSTFTEAFEDKAEASELDKIKENLFTMPGIKPRDLAALKRREIDMSSEESKLRYLNTALRAFSKATNTPIDDLSKMKTLPLDKSVGWMTVKGLANELGIDITKHTYEDPSPPKRKRPPRSKPDSENA